MRTWYFSSSGTLFFGRQAVRHHLRDACERLGSKRAFIVTDAVLVKAGLVAQVVEPLTAAGVSHAVFDAVTPEPPVEVVRDCANAARLFNPDVVIGLGGGSNMDTAKLVALVLAHGGDPTDYTGDCRVPGPVKPLVCIPTTAGTGSEVFGRRRLHRHGQANQGKLPESLPPAHVRHRRSALHDVVPAQSHRGFGYRCADARHRRLHRY